MSARPTHGSASTRSGAKQAAAAVALLLAGLLAQATVVEAQNETSPNGAEPSLPGPSNTGTVSVSDGTGSEGTGSDGASPGASEGPVARIVATANVGGRLADPRCDRFDTLVPSASASLTSALVRAARQGAAPYVVDTGGLLAPHGVPRFAAQNEPEGLARMVQRLGYRTLVVGHHDLAARRIGLLRVAAALRERGIPMLASNLFCEGQARPLCEVIVDGSDGPLVHEVGGRRIAIVSVLSPSTLEQIAPERSRGLRLEEPLAALARSVQAARAVNADVVVGIVDTSVEGGVTRLVSQLPPASRPDVVLVGGQSELLFARPMTEWPVIVGAPSDEAVDVGLWATPGSAGRYEVRARRLGGRSIRPARAVREWIEEIGGDYCRDWGRPLPGARLERPIDADGMVELIARVLREATGADIAVVHRDVLDPRWRPSSRTALTASDVLLAIQYDQPLRVADVPQAWIEELADSVDEHPELTVRGARWTRSGDAVTVRVGGHLADGRARYRVVTLRALASGADHEFLPELPSPETWRPENEMTVRETTLDYLSSERTIDPRAALPNPDESIEWVLSGDADLSFSGSSIQNPQRRCAEDAPVGSCDAGGYALSGGERTPAYDNAQLSLQDVLTFGVTLDVRAAAAAPDWTWENTANFVYQTAWTEPTGTGPAAGFAEAADQIRGRSTLAWRGLRDGPSQWFVPDPMLDVFIESEFTEPETRQWHWLLIRPTAGLRFQLADKLQLQLMGGLQTQAIEPDATVEPGIGATLRLLPWDIMSMGDRFTRLAFTLDYFVADLSDDDRGVLRGQLDASFDLAGPLAIVFRLNTLVQHQRGQDVGVALNVTIGLRLGYFGRTSMQ